VGIPKSTFPLGKLIRPFLLPHFQILEKVLDAGRLTSIKFLCPIYYSSEKHFSTTKKTRRSFYFIYVHEDKRRSSSLFEHPDGKGCREFSTGNAGDDENPVRWCVALKKIPTAAGDFFKQKLFEVNSIKSVYSLVPFRSKDSECECNIRFIVLCFIIFV